MNTLVKPILVTTPATTWLPFDVGGWRWFAYRQALASVFPVYIFAIVALTQSHRIPGISRSDTLFVACVLAQALLLSVRYETTRELHVICAFHVIGMALELFKTHHHCWSYPGPAVFRIGRVPLYSGFMYASVASYICQAWRRLNMRLVDAPNWTVSMLLAVAIYANFFTETYIPDLRWLMVPLIFWHFRRTTIEYGADHLRFKQPLTVGLSLVALFIWFAENFCTLYGAWQYPNQASGWHLVHASKLGSWFLLVVIEFLIVARLKHRHGSS